MSKLSPSFLWLPDEISNMAAGGVSNMVAIGFSSMAAFAKNKSYCELGLQDSLVTFMFTVDEGNILYIFGWIMDLYGWIRNLLRKSRNTICLQKRASGSLSKVASKPAHQKQ